MFQCGRTIGARGIIGLIAGALVFVSSRAVSQELRTVLATGDDVPGLGRIGDTGVHLIGLDEAGRALISRTGGEREQVVWADGERVVPLVDPSAAGDVELVGDSLLQSAGNAVGYGFARSSRATWGEALYAVVGGAVQQVARLGEPNPDGYIICDLYTYAVNGSGTVAFDSVITAAGNNCADLDVDDTTTPFYDGVYVFDGALHRVAGDGPLTPSGWDGYRFQLLGLTDDGEAVVAARGAAQSVLALRPGTIRTLYRLGDTDGAGAIAVSTGFQILAVNGAGELLFRRLEHEVASIYRTAGGAVRRVLAEDDAAPWGGYYTTGDAYAWPSAFNARGDVVIVFAGGRAVRYPADAAPQVFPGYALTGALNQHGDVALLLQPTDQFEEVDRYRDGDAQRLAATGDPLPDGGVLAARGLGAACLAPNGAIGVAAQATNTALGLLCGDANGFAPVTRQGDPRPDGRRFYSFDACDFASSDELLFIGTGLAPSGTARRYFRQAAVYRARPDRLERVLGPGDVLSDGTQITALPADWSSLFDADASGRVLTFAATTHNAALVMAHPDGTLERLPLRLRNGVYTTDEIRFEPQSSVDHEYLSGLSMVPRRGELPAAFSSQEAPPPAVRAAASGPHPPGTRAADDPYYDVGAVWVSSVGLAASGGVFVLGSEAIADPEVDVTDRSVVLYVAPDGSVQHIASADDAALPGGPYYRFDGLSVQGDRIAFTAWWSGTTILTYALGDAAPTAVLHAGDPTSAGALLYPYALGITGDGGVYFADYPEGAVQRFLFSWQDAAIQRVIPLGTADIGPGYVSDAGALLASGASALRVIGDAPSGASCPHPPTAVLVTPPTPTPRPGITPRPDDLPLEPASCIPGTVCIRVGDVAGNPGEQVQLRVWLDTGGAPVAGVQNDLLTQPLARLHDCVANPDIDKPATAFSYQGEWTRAIVLSLTNTDPLPDGVALYSCTVDIAADAAPGYYLFTCSNPGISDPSGNALPVSCADGLIAVAVPRQGDAAQLTGGHGSGGCAIQASARGSAWWLLGAFLCVALRGRRTALRPHPKAAAGFRTP